MIQYVISPWQLISDIESNGHFSLTAESKSREISSGSLMESRLGEQTAEIWPKYFESLKKTKQRIKKEKKKPVFPSQPLYDK